MGEWWIDLALEDQLQFVGRWAEKFPGAFDNAWMGFEDEVLVPLAYYPKNAWTMDEERQQVFVDFLVNTCQEFNRFLECAYADAMEPGWGLGDSE